MATVETPATSTPTPANSALQPPPAAPQPIFGRLEAQKVRDHWKDEARDFTPWLAKESNLELLGETLGLSLELVGTEQRVGPFKADIVASDGENTVIIENQLDATDHKHLGQLMVYAAGRGASTVVWVAKQVTDEYRKVIDWLNEETSVNFWALEVELWKIGDSPVAPKFNVVCEPNELTQPDLSGTKLLQLEFWKGVGAYFEEHSAQFTSLEPQPSHSINLPIGTARAKVTMTALVSRSGRIGCELYINHSHSSAIFEALADDKIGIEQELGELDWQPLPEKKACRIAAYRQASIENRESWPVLFVWLKQQAEAFKATFAERVKALSLPAPDGIPPLEVEFDEPDGGQ